jgi:hypothetical protein
MVRNTFLSDVIDYASNVRSFNRTDWIAYVAWVGLMFGLFFATLGFLLVGHFHGVTYPAYAWNVPIGCFIFSLAISFDTIGHRTIYRDELLKAEGFVHNMTIVAGITSVVALCLAYSHRDAWEGPAMILTIMSLLYTIVDEAMHWIRYLSKKSDRVEMWSHFFIILGHGIMMWSWWVWYKNGYQGVAETLPYFH